MIALKTTLLVLAGAAVFAAPPPSQPGTQRGGELRLSLRHDPKTFDPALVEEDAGETIRYFTGGVLIRMNRMTQKAEAGLAESWKMSPDGRRLHLRLRAGLRFSDGTPLTTGDVAFTFQRLMDPALKSPTGDSFRSGAGAIATSIRSPVEMEILFPAAVASIERLLDQVAIQSARSPLKERAVAGPFAVKEYKAGAFVLLARNPNYWKMDALGQPLPYLDAVRFAIQSNREMESVRLRRGELQMVDGLDAELFQRLKAERGVVTADAGPNTDVEMMWFNQAGGAPLPGYKKAWFASREFRQGINAAINRDDIVRLVYRTWAQPAAGPLPPSSLWFNRKLRAQPHDPQQARRWFERAGFVYAGGQLRDARGNAVAFSIVTNSSSTVRGRIAALIQQDLQKVGVKVTLAPLEFRSLIQRIGETADYEACLLGMVNVDDDPNGQMNVWLSSSANHPWNPAQKSPATPWEAEIDGLMTRQASSADQRIRKQAFDRVQELVREQAPVIYLVNPHALVAYASELRGLEPAPSRPHLFWNIERLCFGNRSFGNPGGAPMPGPLLRISLGVGYPGKPDVLRGLELAIGEREIVGLVGQSGSGKSTLGLAIPRLLAAAAQVSGEIRYRGTDLLRLSEREMRRIRGKEIGVVFQGASSALNPALRLGTQLREVWRAHRGAREWRREGREQVAALLAAMHLPHDDEFLRRYPGQVSIGQAQRVLIAMAVMHRPALAIADEPTSALDMVTQAEVLELMRGLRDRFGSSLLFISHDLAAVAAVCDRLAILYDGRIVEMGPTAGIFAAARHPYTQALLRAMPARSLAALPACVR